MTFRALMFCAAAFACSQAQAQQQLLTYSSGTGFFINREGSIVTSAHVVAGCRDITVSGPIDMTTATVEATDKEHDLALLKARARVTDAARLSTDKQPLKEGDPVVVFGFPGQSWQTGRATMRKASVVEMKALGSDNLLAFSDALEQGNSGGPLLDSSGNVIGVVAAKGQLYERNETAARDELVQKFDVAISLPLLREFLRANGARYQEVDSGIYLSAERVADDARRFVVNVRCQLENKR